MASATSTERLLIEIDQQESVKSILIVDDNEMLLELLAKGFEMFGMDVFTADNGLDGWNFFNSDDIWQIDSYFLIKPEQRNGHSAAQPVTPRDRPPRTTSAPVPHFLNGRCLAK